MKSIFAKSFAGNLRGRLFSVTVMVGLIFVGMSSMAEQLGISDPSSISSLTASATTRKSNGANELQKAIQDKGVATLRFSKMNINISSKRDGGHYLKAEKVPDLISYAVHTGNNQSGIISGKVSIDEFKSLVKNKNNKYRYEVSVRDKDKLHRFRTDESPTFDDAGKMEFHRLMVVDGAGNVVEGNSLINIRSENSLFTITIHNLSN